MPKPVSVSRTVTSTASPERVWEVLADHEKMPDWTPLKTVRLDPPGTDERNGVGAVRVMRNSPITFREEVVAFEPPKRLVYRVIGGLPTKDHTGEVTLEPTGDGGTRITWSAEYTPDMPAASFLLRWLIRRALDDLAEGLAEHAARDVA